LVKAVLAELLKMRKRWMPYALLLVTSAGAVFFVWVVGYVSWENVELEESALRTFSLPYAIPALLDTGQFWGTAIFVTIFTSSSVATEHNWGTVRQAVARGQTRTEYLLAKLTAIAIVSAGALLLVFALGLVMAVLATLAAGLPVTMEAPNGPSLADVILMIARTALAILPYGFLVFFLSVLGRSTALGLAGGLGYMILESIAIAVFVALGGTAGDIAELMIGRHAAALIAVNRFAPFDYNSAAPRPLPDPAELPDPWLAAAVLALYCVVFAVLAFTLFHRRDIPVTSAV
jgi:ABC-2 type transport system permease protein